MSASPFWPEREVEGKGIESFVRERLDLEHNDILYVCGNCGCGKTSTVTQLPSCFLPHNGLRKPVISYINCADLSAGGVLNTLGQAVGLRTVPHALAAARKAVAGAISSPVDLTKFPVVILDEIEAAKSQGHSELRRVVETALLRGGSSLAVIIVSNSKQLFAVDPSRIRSVTFQPYSIGQMKSIASRWSAEWGVSLAPAALDVVAKTAANTYNGDLRKLRSLCAAGASASDSLATGAASKTHRSEKRALALADPNAARDKPIVTVSDIRKSHRDVPSSSVATIRELPQQMLFLLCVCCKISADQEETASRHTVTLRAAHAAFIQAAGRVGFGMVSVNETRTLLESLSDHGLLASDRTRPTFGVCVHRQELVDALQTSGTAFEVARSIAFAS